MSSESEKNRRLEWDEVYMAIALVASQRSPDKKLKVGACIMGEEGAVRTSKGELQPKRRLMSMGYNGSPYGSEWPENDEDKHDMVVHAEENALIHSFGSTMGATMYVTLHPCFHCAKLIVQSGIKRVVYMQRKDGKEKAKNTFKIEKAKEILDRNFVEVVKYYDLESVKKDEDGNIKPLEFEYESVEGEDKMKFKMNFNDWDYNKKRKIHEEDEGESSTKKKLKKN